MSDPQLEERRAENPGLCLEEIMPNDTDFEAWCDLPLGHDLPHKVWDTIPELNHFDKVGKEWIHASEVTYRIEWPVAKQGAEEPIASLFGLTPRQTEVLSLMAKGYSNVAISSEMVLEIISVENYANVVYQKLGLSENGDLNCRVAAVLVYLGRMARRPSGDN